MSRLVLSSHLDDAVFSAFHVLGVDSIVTTLCTALPDSTDAPSNYDKLTGSSNATRRYQERQAEDLTVAACMGWQAVHFGLLDAPYRRTDPDPESVAREIVESIDAGQVSELWGPAGIGGHRDHLLTRTVTLCIGKILDRPIHLYADLPYAATFGWPGWVNGLQPSSYLDIDAFWRRWCLPEVDIRSHATIHHLDQRSQDRKLELCALYRTQFPVSEAGPSRLLSHPDRVAVEVSWALSQN